MIPVVQLHGYIPTTSLETSVWHVHCPNNCGRPSWPELVPCESGSTSHQCIWLVIAVYPSGKASDPLRSLSECTTCFNAVGQSLVLVVARVMTYAHLNRDSQSKWDRCFSNFEDLFSPGSGLWPSNLRSVGVYIIALDVCSF